MVMKKWMLAVRAAACSSVAQVAKPVPKARLQGFTTRLRCAEVLTFHKGAFQKPVGCEGGASRVGRS